VRAGVARRKVNGARGTLPPPQSNNGDRTKRGNLLSKCKTSPSMTKKNNEEFPPVMQRKSMLANHQLAGNLVE